MRAVRLCLAIVTLVGCGRLRYEVVENPDVPIAMDSGDPDALRDVRDSVVEGDVFSDVRDGGDGALPPDEGLCAPFVRPPPPSGVHVSMAHLYASSSDATWSQSLRAGGGRAPYRWQLMQGPPGFTVDAAGLASYAPGAEGTLNVDVQVTDDLAASVTATIALHVLAGRLCVWNGLSSADWATARNWDFCAGTTPSTSDWIAVDRAAPVYPLLGTSTTVRGVGASAIAGGTLRIAPAATLTLRDQARTILSTIRFEGQSPSCVDCIVTGEGYVEVTDGAGLVLGPGIEFQVGSHTTLLLGGGGPAQFAACGGGSTADTWPTFGSAPASDPGVYGVRVEGSVAEPAVVQFNGLVFENLHPAGGSLFGAIHLVQHYVLLRLDNVTFRCPYAGEQERAIVVEGCATGEARDTMWEALTFEFNGAPEVNDLNIDMTCGLAASVCLPDELGAATGPAYELDLLGIVHWRSDADFATACP